jgi:hypothetical protein
MMHVSGDCRWTFAQLADGVDVQKKMTPTPWWSDFSLRKPNRPPEIAVTLYPSTIR